MRSLLLCLLFAAVVFAAPSVYNMKKLPVNQVPAIDGNLQEWSSAYIIDSVRSDSNVFARDGGTWTRAEFQMIVYAAYDDNKVYYAVKVVADDNYIVGQSWNADNLKIRLGGQATGFYINSNGASPILNPSCPFQVGVSLWAGTQTRGNGNLPTYEFAMNKDVLDPFEGGYFQIHVGTEDIDTVTVDQYTFLAIGASYTGYKQDWNSNPWDNTLYYPTFNFSAITGPDLNGYVSDSTHVFWYKCVQNNYTLTDNPGPNLPANVIKHEGMLLTATLRQSAGNSDPTFCFGSGLDDAQGRIGCFWAKDLMNYSGTVKSAKFRAEYQDGWSGNAFCNAGPIHLRVGVVDFEGNIDAWGAADDVPETATWQDPLNPLTGTMGYDFSTSVCEAETLYTFNAPAARTSADADPLLEKQFIELDVTKQVNWILAHTGVNKGVRSGQYAIVFLCKMGEGSTGKIRVYSDESRTGTLWSPAPWTTDGNTSHLVVVGNLQDSGAVDLTPPVISNFMINSVTCSSFVAHCTTNEYASCWVLYGPVGRYTQISGYSAWGYTHNVHVSGLLPNTAYNIRMVAQDYSGNIDTGSALVCTTGTGVNQAPVFSTVSPQDTVISAPDTLMIYAHATDPDIGDTITYYWFHNDSFLQSGRTMDLCAIRAGFTASGLDTVKIVAFDGHVQTIAWVFITLRYVSIPPAILLPANGARVSDDSILGWMPSPDAFLKGTKRYTLQFSSSSYFTDTLGVADSVTGSLIAMKNVSCASRLPKSSIVFWRISEFDSLGHRTAWSSGLNFFVFMGVNTTGAEDSAAVIMPTEYGLSRSEPNPCNPSTVIRFAVPQSGHVTLQVFDTKGQCVRTLVNGAQNAGYHKAVFDGLSQDGKALSSGLYVYRREAAGFVKTRTFVLMK